VDGRTGRPPVKLKQRRTAVNGPPPNPPPLPAILRRSRSAQHLSTTDQRGRSARHFSGAGQRCAALLPRPAGHTPGIVI